MSFVKLMVVQELDPLQDDRLEIACGLAHKFGSELVGTLDIGEVQNSLLQALG